MPPIQPPPSERGVVGRGLWTAAGRLPIVGWAVEVIRSMAGTRQDRELDQWLREELYPHFVIVYSRSEDDLRDRMNRPLIRAAAESARRLDSGPLTTDQRRRLRNVLVNAAVMPTLDESEELWVTRYVEWIGRELDDRHLLVLQRLVIPTNSMGVARSGDPDDQARLGAVAAMHPRSRAILVEELEHRGLIRGSRVQSASERTREMTARAAGWSPMTSPPDSAPVLSDLSNASITARGRDLLEWATERVRADDLD